MCYSYVQRSVTPAAADPRTTYDFHHFFLYILIKYQYLSIIYYLCVYNFEITVEFRITQYNVPINDTDL